MRHTWYPLLLSFLDLKSKVRCERVSRSFHGFVQVCLAQHQHVLETEPGSSACGRRASVWHLDSPPKPLVDVIPSELLNKESMRQVLTRLLDRCLNLRRVHLTLNTISSPHEILSLLMDHCPRLEQLHLSCPHVRVTWSGSVFEAQMQSVIARLTREDGCLPHLHSLTLPFLSTAQVAQLLQHKRMRRVDASIHNEVVMGHHLAHASDALTVFAGSMMLSECALTTLAGSCRRLQRLWTGPVSNAGLTLMAQLMPGLKDLSVHLLRSFDVERLPDLGLFRGLERLQLQTHTHKHLDGSLLQLLRQTGQSLECLSLHGFLLTDLSLSFVSLLAPRLTRLRVQGSTFVPHGHGLALAPGITDDSFKSFARFPVIEMIDVDQGNRVTQAGLAFLMKHAASPCIRRVRVWDSQSNGLLSLVALEAAAAYCRVNVSREWDRLVLCLDHQIKAEEGDEDMDDDDMAVDQVYARREREAQHRLSIEYVRLLLHQFDQETRPKNMHLTVRLASQSLVFA